MKVIDLTHEINTQMSVFPGTPEFELKQIASIDKDLYLEHQMLMVTHLGTHIDAPSHILNKGKRLVEYDIEKFIGKAYVLDVSGTKDYITKDDLLTIPNLLNMEFILFYTGASKDFATQAYFKTFPVLDDAACDLITDLSNHKLKGVGVDCISIDPIEPLSIDNHIKLLSHDLVIIENLKDIHKLIGLEFIISVMPLKVEKIEGSPIRAFAMIL